MKSIINELWHGNIIPQEDSRTNSKEMKKLLGYKNPGHHTNLRSKLCSSPPKSCVTGLRNEVFEK